MNIPVKMNFLDAENLATQMAYEQFYGKGEAIGVAFTFIKDRKKGNEWSDEEKSVAIKISDEAIARLKARNLTQFITQGIVPDCAMARRFMATGSGQTASGYNF